MVDENYLGWVMIFSLKEGNNFYFQGDGFEVGDWHPHNATRHEDLSFCGCKCLTSIKPVIPHYSDPILHPPHLLSSTKMLSLTSVPHIVLATTLTAVQAALLMFVNLYVIYPA